MPGHWSGFRGTREPDYICWEYFKDDSRRDPYKIKCDDGDYATVLFVARHLERDYSSDPREQREEALASAKRALLDNPYKFNRQQLRHTLMEDMERRAEAAKCEKRDAEDVEERRRH